MSEDEFCTCYSALSYPEIAIWRTRNAGHLHVVCGKFIIRKPDIITTIGPVMPGEPCQHINTTLPLYNGGNYGHYGTMRCLDCGATKDDWSDWKVPETDEDTVPDRNVPPSQRDLSTHAPDCNCMGCFYRDDR